MARRGSRRSPVALACSAFLNDVGPIAERHPDVKLIVDHFGRGGGATDEAAWANLPDLLALAPLSQRGG